MTRLQCDTLVLVHWYWKLGIGSQQVYDIFCKLFAGFRAAAPRDYSLLGTKADVSFRSIGSLATIAFAFNSNILPEMQVSNLNASYLTSTINVAN